MLSFSYRVKEKLLCRIYLNGVTRTFLKSILERDSQSKDSKEDWCLLLVRWRKNGRITGAKWSGNRVSKWHWKGSANSGHTLVPGHDKDFTI